jgi:hypothetical protein
LQNLHIVANQLQDETIEKLRYDEGVVQNVPSKRQLPTVAAIAKRIITLGSEAGGKIFFVDTQSMIYD